MVCLSSETATFLEVAMEKKFAQNITPHKDRTPLTSRIFFGEKSAFIMQVNIVISLLRHLFAWLKAPAAKVAVQIMNTVDTVPATL